VEGSEQADSQQQRYRVNRVVCMARPAWKLAHSLRTSVAQVSFTAQAEAVHGRKDAVMDFVEVLIVPQPAVMFLNPVLSLMTLSAKQAGDAIVATANVPLKTIACCNCAFPR
jgi:hypothetical protein